MHGHRILAGAAAAALLTTSLASPALAFGARVPDPIPPLVAPGTVTGPLQTLASGLVSPVTGCVAPGDHKHLFLSHPPGPLWRPRLRRGGGAPPPRAPGAARSGSAAVSPSARSRAPTRSGPRRR